MSIAHSDTHLGDAQPIRVLHGALLTIVGKTRNAQPPSFQTLPGITASMNLVCNFFPSTGTRVCAVELHEAAAEA